MCRILRLWHCRKMILSLVIVVGAVAFVHAVPPGGVCTFDNDISQFYWKGQNDLCTDDSCKKGNYKACQKEIYDQDYLNNMMTFHEKDDIPLQIKAMKEYFNTYPPTPTYTKKYECTGLCQHNKPIIRVERVFTNVHGAYKSGENVTSQVACIVLGPDIYYRHCGGRCRNTPDSYCLTDVWVKVKVWVYCPDVSPGCRKVQVEVPWSCACKKITCLYKDRPVGVPKAFILPKIPNGKIYTP